MISSTSGNTSMKENMRVKVEIDHGLSGARQLGATAQGNRPAREEDRENRAIGTHIAPKGAQLAISFFRG